MSPQTPVVARTAPMKLLGVVIIVRHVRFFCLWITSIGRFGSSDEVLQTLAMHLIATARQKAADTVKLVSPSHAGLFQGGGAGLLLKMHR